MTDSDSVRYISRWLRSSSLNTPSLARSGTTRDSSDSYPFLNVPSYPYRRAPSSDADASSFGSGPSSFGSNNDPPWLNQPVVQRAWSHSPVAQVSPQSLHTQNVQFSGSHTEASRSYSGSSPSWSQSSGAEDSGSRAASSSGWSCAPGAWPGSSSSGSAGYTTSSSRLGYVTKAFFTNFPDYIANNPWY